MSGSGYSPKEHALVEHAREAMFRLNEQCWLMMTDTKNQVVMEAPTRDQDKRPLAIKKAAAVLAGLTLRDPQNIFAKCFVYAPGQCCGKCYGKIPLVGGCRIKLEGSPVATFVVAGSTQPDRDARILEYALERVNMIFDAATGVWKEAPPGYEKNKDVIDYTRLNALPSQY